MTDSQANSKGRESGTAVVVGIALATILAHLATGWRYGFDRDELMALEDARHLAWGYVQYPPLTAFLGRVALILFGTSLVGFRFFAALAMAIAVVLTGLMAKEMGGGKWAQVTAALAAVPFCLGAGALMQYMSFDYACWVLLAYCVAKVASAKKERKESKSDEGEKKESSDCLAVHPAYGTTGSMEVRDAGKRWWVGVGAAMGLGMLAKYTMGFLVAGVVAGVLSTPHRRHWRSGWLWMGVLVSLLVVLPNFLWQWKHRFVSLEFLRFLHARDVATGQTDWFLAGQLELTMLAFPLALAGLWSFFFSDEGRRYRVLGWMYVLPLLLFLVMRGRDYYLAPAYPMLYAAGAVWVERSWRMRSVRERAAKSISRQDTAHRGGCPAASGEAEKPPPGRHDLVENGENGKWKILQRMIWVALLLDVVVAAAVALPIAPVNSRWWRLAARVDTVLPEEIGWPEFVEAVAQVRDRLPLEERARVGILAGNYGEVGALNLYGEKFGLPRAIGGVNSSWERGYGDAPEVLIVVGYPRTLLETEFASCVVGGRVWNQYGVRNEETIEDPDIFVCRGLRGGWPEFWQKVRKFA